MHDTAAVVHNNYRRCLLVATAVAAEAVKGGTVGMSVLNAVAPAPVAAAAAVVSSKNCQGCYFRHWTIIVDESVVFAAAVADVPDIFEMVAVGIVEAVVDTFQAFFGTIQTVVLLAADRTEAVAGTVGFVVAAAAVVASSVGGENCSPRRSQEH